jgi:CHAD domain-containing protein
LAERDEAVRSTADDLRNLLDNQLAVVEEAADDLERDLDGSLHLARVALRRLRGSLVLFGGLLHETPARALRQELSWLAGCLGPARDAQVLLDRVRAAVAARDLENGDGLAALFRQRYDDAAAVASEAVGSERCTALLERLHDARTTLVAPVATMPYALAELVAGELDQLAVALQEIVPEPAGPDHDVHLHELRKTVKRVRYAREATGEIAGRAAGGPVDTSLKELQDLLGSHQDAVLMRRLLDEVGTAGLDDTVRQLAAAEERAISDSAGRLAEAVGRLVSAMRVDGR